MNGPKTKESPICALIELTNINRKISQPPTGHLLVWNTIQFILHAFLRQRRFFLNPGLTLKKGLPSFQTTLLGLDLKCTPEQKKPQIMTVYFSGPQVSSTHEQYRSLLLPPPPCPYRRKRMRKIGSHARTKNMPSASEQKLSM